MTSLNSIFYFIKTLFSNKDISVCTKSEIINTDDLFEIHYIPTIGDDRKNLKADSENVIRDYKKSYNIKKAELSL